MEKYKRILLKVSGESLAGDNKTGINFERVLEICQETGCKVRILPGTKELIRNKPIMENFRNIEIEDLLGRDTIKLDNKNIGELIMKARLPQGMGGGPQNMQNMLRQAQKMQENMQKMQEELEAKEVEASVGGGAVTVKANGKKEVIDIAIKPEVVDPDDIEMLQDLVLSAVNEALRKVDDMQQSQMSKVTGGMNIPGLF